LAEPRPWRNLRPAPDLTELHAKTPLPRGYAWLWAWWPALLWAGVIFLLSTDIFSAEHTGLVIGPVLRWIRPGLSEDQIIAIHYFARKCAHFTEYFIFCVLLYRGVRGKRTGWRWTWGFEALFLAAVYSALDEIHQAFVSSRTASVYDSLLDSAGAFVAMAALWLWFRSRRSAIPPVAAPSPDSVS
jgi:VanZ family protein